MSIMDSVRFYQQGLNMHGDVLNHFLLTISIMGAWAIALYMMGGKQVFWDYNQFPDETQSDHQ